MGLKEQMERRKARTYLKAQAAKLDSFCSKNPECGRKICSKIAEDVAGEGKEENQEDE